MTDLKKCPFCGGEPEMIHAVLEEYHSVNPEIICRECGYRIKAKNLAIAIADSPKENCKFMDRQTSRMWNTRPAEDALKAEVEGLKVELDNLRHFYGTILDMAKRNNGVLYFKQDSGTWKIKTGKDTNVPANAPDTGKMEG